jgi:hypothetical protein
MRGCVQRQLRAIGELIMAGIGQVLLLWTVDVGGANVGNGVISQV